MDVRYLCNEFSITHKENVLSCVCIMGFIGFPLTAVFIDHSRRAIYHNLPNIDSRMVIFKTGLVRNFGICK